MCSAVNFHRSFSIRKISTHLHLPSTYTVRRGETCVETFSWEHYWLISTKIPHDIGVLVGFPNNVFDFGGGLPFFAVFSCFISAI